MYLSGQISLGCYSEKCLMHYKCINVILFMYRETIPFIYCTFDRIIKNLQ